MNTKSNSLIMCATPLQMLIAEKIIKSKPYENFDLITIALSDNLKYKSYFERVNKRCNFGLYFIANPGLKGFVKFIRTLKLNNLDKEYKNLYLASIDSRYFQYLVSKNDKANIFTFDDGTANIIKESSYYLDSKPPLWKRIIWRSFGVKYYIDDIKSMSLTHYTIYNGIPNIIDNTKFLELYNTNKQKQNDIKNVVKIFLGQPLSEISSHYTKNYITEIIEKIGVDYYYPHPRETSPLSGNFEVIESSLIFEEYIIQCLTYNPHTIIEIYSFVSSCLLNINQLDRVHTIYIYDEFLYNKFNKFYKLANNKFNINLKNIKG